MKRFSAGEAPPAMPAGPCGIEHLEDCKPYFRAAMHGLFDGVCFVDAGHAIRYWSSAAERITGYSSEEMVGNTCRGDALAFCDETGTSLCDTRCSYAAVAKINKPITRRAFFRHKDGRRIGVDLNLLPVIDDDGRMLGMVKVFHDASSMIALERAYQRVRELNERDPHTGTVAARALSRLLTESLELLTLAGVPFTLTLLEISDLSLYSQVYGPEAAEDTVVRISRLLMENARKTDIVIRLTDAEFLVLMPHALLQETHITASRLLSELDCTPMPALGGRTLTARSGSVQADTEDSRESLMKRLRETLSAARVEGSEQSAVPV